MKKLRRVCLQDTKIVNESFAVCKWLGNTTLSIISMYVHCTYYTSFILNKIVLLFWINIQYLQTIHNFLSKSVHCAPHSPLLSKSVHCAPHSLLLSKSFHCAPPLTTLYPLCLFFCYSAVAITYKNQKGTLSKSKCHTCKDVSVYGMSFDALAKSCLVFCLENCSDLLIH